MEFGSFDDGQHGEYSGVGFVVRSRIFALEAACFL